MSADASKFGGKKISLSALEAWGRGSDEFTKGTGCLDISGRIRASFTAMARLATTGIEICMTGPNGEYGELLIPYGDMLEQEHNFTPANVRALLTDFSRRIAMPTNAPLLVPKSFLGM